ncbi:MAG TPA: hypothetical protein VIQ97_05645 [Prevotella sp.]
MKIVRNRILPFKKYDAINLMGILFCHRSVILTDDLLRHERIHTAQMVEMGYIGFYLWYVAEWLIRLFMHGRAYENISLEREAYAHMYETHYLKRRRHYAWVRFLKGGNAPNKTNKTSSRG